jgi:hypothetical protein
MRSKLLYGAVVVLLCVVCVFIYQYFSKSNVDTKVYDGEVNIVLTETGYEPKDVIVRQGTKVIFSTTRGTSHWPASNLHPSHGIYPAFDPLKPVDKDKSWSFDFDRVGTWNFHDHLRSYFRGSITVVE